MNPDLLKRIAALLALFCCAFVLSTVYLLPARYILHRFPHAVPMPILVGVEGSVWQGQAKAAYVGGLSLGQLRWSLDWQSLGSAELGFKLRLTAADVKGLGLLRITPSGDVQLRVDKLRLPVAKLITLTAPLGTLPGGVVEMESTTLDWRGGQLQAVRGSVRWQGAVVQAPALLELGDISGKIDGTPDAVELRAVSPEPSSVESEIRLTGGRIHVTGSISSASLPKAWLERLRPARTAGRQRFDFQLQWPEASTELLPGVSAPSSPQTKPDTRP